MLGSLKQTLRRPLAPLARWLQGAGARPNHITVAGLAASLLSGISLASGHLTLGLIWMLVGLLGDMLDGDLARLGTARPTLTGAFLDSCADRVSEAAVLTGLLVGKARYGGGLDWPWLVVWAAALSGGFMVSYARARAEGLGISCTVGLGERPERMVVLVALLLVGFRASGWFLLGLAVISWFTVYQRAAHVARADRAAVPPEGR